MNTTGWLKGLRVTADGTGIVSHAGVALIRALADNSGLTAGRSSVLASDRLLVHDRGRMVADLLGARRAGAGRDRRRPGPSLADRGRCPRPSRQAAKPYIYASSARWLLFLHPRGRTGIPGSWRKLPRVGIRAPSVYHVSARVVRQDIPRPGVPQAARTVAELRSEALLRRQFDLTRGAPNVTAIAGSMIAGVGLIAAFLMADFLLGAFLRGAALSGAVLIKTAIVEAGLIVGALLGSFLARE